MVIQLSANSVLPCQQHCINIGIDLASKQIRISVFLDSRLIYIGNVTSDDVLIELAMDFLSWSLEGQAVYVVKNHE